MRFDVILRAVGKGGMRTVLIGLAVVIAAFIVRRLTAGSLNRRPLQAGKLVVITGASSGIGEEIAYLASAKGCRVLLVARGAQALTRVATACLEKGAPAAAVLTADLSSDVDRQRLAQEVNAHATEHPLDCVILNAGRGGITAFNASDATIAIARELMELNYFANVDLVRRLLPTIEKQQSRILAISSLSGVLAVPQRSQYCASKAALQAFLNSVRMELGPRGVQITTVCPSYVQTPFHSKVMNVDGVPPARQGHFMSATLCASKAIDAMESGKSELVMTTSGSWAYRLRPFMPAFIDKQVNRVAQKSFKKE
jgi:dehydrogenase/reductase SDR family protein 7B